ncbi:beta-1,3-galactosyltransferase 5-like [Alosa sapidissima]|uniref:beta-1,3-galactosyltransferase 5-like n=1 Tax=Alosa sapidissima TaxID=34773 RepID=UPI001C09DF03|nr:beta-1,3-galactosyltransferase 5-like [Alosa sapidissima]XP_041956047.1 beta-1,3-galactosyltransferase 5-like [Alosa sapidissima]
MKLPSLSWQFCGLVCASALTSLVILRLLASITQDGPVVLRHWDSRSDPVTHPADRRPSRHRGRGISFEQLQRADQRPLECPRDLLVVILVTSAPWHSEQRDAIRSTWAQKREDTDYPWQVVFLIGLPVELGIYPHIAQEQQDYGDILLGNYVDCYRNLTLKVMHGLWWAAESCDSRFVLKTDDDCFVNTDHLPRYLVEFNKDRTGVYVGSVFRLGRRQVIRDQRSKWYVSKEDFREQEYPPYASGIGYVLSLDVVRELVDVAKDVPPVPMEDAYVGVLAREAGVPVRDSGRFAKQNVNWRVCNYRYLMVIHHLDAGQLKEAQQSMLNARSACNQTKEITGWK